MSESKAFRADLARSARLFRAFRTEQTAPEAYYTALAQDTVHQLSQYAELDGRSSSTSAAARGSSSGN